MNQEKRMDYAIVAQVAMDWAMEESTADCLEHPLKDCAQAIRDLLEKTSSLGEDLVAEAARTAEEKLRADQMTEQHRMQCNMRQESQDVLDAAKDHIRDLEAQLSAIGAGGVEALRKREQAIESVLIDGIAYEVPAAVAGELLSLHLDLLAAAPAQPLGVTIDFKQATELLAMFGGEPAEITLIEGPGHSGKGVYAYYSDLPEEGAEFLGKPDNEALPAAPAQEHATQLAGQEFPGGWKKKFADAVYEDLAAADNQDIPLEEYPARILKVLDGVVGPRHPSVVQWRNDAIRQCIAIAYRYCRDPESHGYLKQDLQALISASPAQARKDEQA